MTRCGNPKNQDSHSAWKSLAKGARLSHISNTGPTVIITTRNYQQEGVGQIRRSKVGQTGWTNPPVEPFLQPLLANGADLVHVNFSVFPSAVYL